MPKQRFESLLANYCAPALKQYKYANMFHLPKDDDSIRSFIKPFVIARKNFLFSNTKKGAKASTIYLSLIESAKNKLNPYKYLEYVLDILRTKGLSNEIKNSVLPYSKQLPKNLYVKKE